MTATPSRTGQATAVGLSHTVTVLPAAVSFECSEDETILEAAIRRGFALPYGCRKGNCGTCKAQVLEGDVDLEIESIYTLSEFEKEQGFTLLCSAYVMSDTTVEMDGLDVADLDEAGAAPGDYVGEVVEIKTLTHDIRGLTVALEAPLEFRSGQFAQVELPGSGVSRSYSMANPSSRPNLLEFLIKLVPDGVFSGHLERMTVGQELRIHGPHGAFWLRPNNRPLLLVGGGAGLAPLLGMLQELSGQRDQRPVRFFYGARTEADLFYVDRIAALGEDLADFEFIPCLSHAGSGDGPALTRGMVGDVVAERLGRDIAGFDAYLCGPPPMIDATVVHLEAHGLELRKSIFYDKFTAS